MPSWEKVSFVLASQARFMILTLLNASPAIPTDLAHSLGLGKPTVSLALKELSEARLVECLTPERRKARMYGITKGGKDVLEEVQKLASGRARIQRTGRNPQKGPDR